jgi:hypothetical protein
MKWLAGGLTGRMPPTIVSADQILTYGERKARPLVLDANVVAYFAALLRLNSTR